MSELTWKCPCCEGAGCEECSGTGKRVRTSVDVEGATMHISGNAPLSPEAKSALTGLGAHLMRRYGPNGPKSPDRGREALREAEDAD